MDELADTRPQDPETDGFALLTALSEQGWSAVVTAAGDDSGEIVVTVQRFGSGAIREQGTSVAELAPLIVERALAA
jgi:hypothetical protein